MKKMLASLLLGCTLSAAAIATPVISNVTGGGGPFTTFYGGSTGDVIGYSFRADSNLTVSALGVWGDGGPGQDGVLDSAHQVGLWTIGGTLLASASVDSTGTLLDGFYYNSIGAVNLTAGSDYVLGAMYTASDSDTYFSPGSFTTNSISLTEGRFPDAGDLGFVFPTSASPGNAGRIGPNMMADATAVPEPAGLLLVGLALTALAATRRRSH